MCMAEKQGQNSHMQHVGPKQHAAGQTNGRHNGGRIPIHVAGLTEFKANQCEQRPVSSMAEQGPVFSRAG